MTLRELVSFVFQLNTQHTLTEMEDRRATVTDALQSTTFRLYSSTAAPVTGAAAPAGTPAASVPRHKVQARHALYFEIRNP